MDIQSTLLYQDDTLLAVNKPPGLLTIPDGYNPALPYLSGLLQQQFGRLWVVHRLDKDTSGVILFARSAEIHRQLNLQFERRETRKEYHALVAGIPDWEETEISLPLRVNGDRRHRTVIDRQAGRSAQTGVRVLRKADTFALVAAFPHTGYTHQIRAHLAAIGFPILGDPLYRSLIPGSPTKNQPATISQSLMSRTALHAYQIQFTHPGTALSLTIQAPYASDFQQAVDAA